MFPEIRLPSKGRGLFDETEADTASIPDIMRVMDLQQEQLARSLGEGHRVIHGVAGSGKTLILGYRAEHLAKACAKPVLVLCYNKALARRLAHWMNEKGVAEKVHVRSFHQWCRSELVAYNIDLPPDQANKNAWMAELVDRLIRAVDRKQIPGGQYDAVLIDEGHDFRPEWLKLVVQMVDPRTNSLLVLYDDAQSIYDRGGKVNFSFKSVGIQAQGRTTILKVNYRNTREILEFAAALASEHLQPAEADEDGVPRIAPVSAGRHGPMPVVKQFPSVEAEAKFIADRFREARKAGTPWKDMAVLYRQYYPVGKAVQQALVAGKIPLTWKDEIRFGDTQDTVKLLPFHSSKGLEFPVVAIPTGGALAGREKLDQEELRLLYVAMTRATDLLILTETQSS